MKHVLTRLVLPAWLCFVLAFFQCLPALAVSASTLRQDLDLPVYMWQPSTQTPEAIVVAFHGGCLHGGVYQPLGEALATRGYSLISLDLRGYGEFYRGNAGDESDRTFHYEKSKADIGKLLQRLRELYPSSKIFCLGESLGANMALHICHDFPQSVDGVIAVSTYARPRLFFHPYMLVHGLQVITMPWKPLNLAPYFTGRLADNRLSIEHHFADPARRDKQSVVELAKSFIFLRRGRKLVCELSPKIPVLMIHGGKDKLCDTAASRRLSARMPALDRRFVLLPKRGHLLVETPFLTREIIEIIGSWLDEHSAAQPSLAVAD